MKKLLLILLCLPFIGFGQENNNKPTFEEALSKSNKKVIFEVVEQRIRIFSKLYNIEELKLTASNGEINVLDKSKGLYALTGAQSGDIKLFVKKDNQVITSYNTFVRRIPAPKSPEDMERIKQMISGLMTIHID